MTASIPPSLSPVGRRQPQFRAAFTLVEVLVSLTVLSMLLLISAQVIGQVQNTWTASNARVSQFREARTAFDILTRNLSQATLNTYMDYDFNYLETVDKDAVTSAAAVQAPSRYVRKSDLQFTCGTAVSLLEDVGGADYVPGSAVFFQAPLGISQQPTLVGLDRLLCGRGYFVQFSSDAFFLPPFLPPGQLRYRYRLMEFCPPAERNLVYATAPKNGEPAGEGPTWFEDAGAEMETDENPLNLSMNRPVADNIVALLISPRKEGGEPWINNDSAFDSRDPSGTGGADQGTQHLLPPMLKIVLVAIDERSAQRLSNFETVEEPPLRSQLEAFQATAVEDAMSDASLEEALLQLKAAFIEEKINFRVFSATVQIRGSKWSS